jgi:enhancing lycopene biosynthesis protein 2
MKTGSRVEDKMIHEILIDKKNRIITAPCYMMDASISEIRLNIKSAIEALKELYDA